MLPLLFNRNINRFINNTDIQDDVDMLNLVTLSDIGIWIINISLPLIAIYFAYIILTKSYKYMGFSSIEAVFIVFITFIFHFEIIISDINLTNIYLMTYQNWIISINMGGAVIPILISLYFIYKKKLPIKKLLVGLIIVTTVAFLISNPVANKGIVSPFPYWLFPAIFASIISIIFLWKDFLRAAPFAYIIGTLGVLIGADFFHLPELLSNQPSTQINAIIGGAVAFDMIFLTGILAVIIDGIIMYRQRNKAGIY